MCADGYWGATLRRRLNRRRLLGGGASVAAGAAALLAACGGGNKKQTAASSSGPASGSPAASGPPKRGGTLGIVQPSSTNNLNPVTNFQEGYGLSGWNVHDRLVSARPTFHFSNQSKLEAAASAEQPDSTTAIFKLRPGMKYQDLPPVNGRLVVASDVVKNQNFVGDNPKAENNSFQRGSMDSVMAPDDQTVIFKLKAPNAYLFSGTQLANSGAQCIHRNCTTSSIRRTRWAAARTRWTATS